MAIGTGSLERMLRYVNPLSPDMKMYILLTVLYTSLMELIIMENLCKISRCLILGHHFLYSHYLNV